MKGYSFLYLVFLIVVFFIFSMPAIGANGLNAFLLKHIAILVWGIIIAILEVVDVLVEKKKALTLMNQNVEQYKAGKKQIGKIIFATVLCIMCVGLGIVGITRYQMDAGTQPCSMRLVACQVSSHRSGRSFTRTTKLYGWNANKHYSFIISGLSKDEIKRLTYSTGTVDIIYYPNTGVITEFECEPDPAGIAKVGDSSEQYYYSVVGQGASDFVHDIINGNSNGLVVVHSNTEDDGNVNSLGTGDNYYLNNSDSNNANDNQITNITDSFLQETQGDLIAALGLDTNEVIKDINENSNLPILLVKDDEQVGGSQDNGQAENKLSASEVVLSENSYHLFGVKIGDSGITLAEILTNRGFAKISYSEGNYDAPEGTEENYYIAGTVKVWFYIDPGTDEIVQIRLLVE